jgi:chloramphenicol-sensitive protein RarD
VNEPSEQRVGLLSGLAAYGLWGLMPLYFNALRPLAALPILEHRIVWSTVLLVVLLTITRRWPALIKCLRDFKLVLTLLTTALLLAVNWVTYIWGVTHDQVLYTSLGYFVNPLVSILLGMLFLGERLRRLQWLAVLLAAGGLVFAMSWERTVPWITLTLACSFGVYGLLRKLAPIDSLVALAIETFVLTVPAACGLVAYARTAPFLGEGQPWQKALLLLSGVATTAPLLLFGIAARRLPLSVLGFLQYLAPSVQFLLGILVFGEAFPLGLQVCFVCTWVGLAVLSAEAVLRQPARQPAEAINDDATVGEAAGDTAAWRASS